MKINKIILHNFKCFEGTHSIHNLADDLISQKNVILLGGLNGTGKTTILESILLCLYGRDNKTLWPSKGAPREDYQNYIIAVINNNVKDSNFRPEMWIEITLCDVELAGTNHTLTIKRNWIYDSEKKSLDDDLMVSEEGKPFDLASKDDWQSFVKELIPYEISQFFFFDGEKIQDFVRDEDREFAASLEKVLGISLYETLRNDLDKVRRRILTEYNKDEDVKLQISKVNTRIAESEKVVHHYLETIDELKSEIISINERIEEIDIQTRRITHVEAETLEEYESKKTDLIAEKKLIEEKFFEVVKDDLPFVISASLLKELNEQLSKEQLLNQQLLAQKEVRPKIKLILKKLFEGEKSTPPLLPEQEKYYAKKLIKILSEVLTKKSDTLKNVRMLHDLGKNDISRIESKMERIQNVINQLKTNLERYQEIDYSLKSISKTEKKTGDPEAAKLYEEKGKLLEKMQFKKDKISQLNAGIKQHKDEIEANKRVRKNLEEKIDRTIQMQKQIDYCRILKNVLENFSHKLRARKVQQLQEFTLDMWSSLSRKEDHIKRIVINPDRQFSIDLYDAKNRLLDKTKLSAGEKEILAISLIWALSKLAERDIPVVIDTPLGRLDTIHRTNIAKNYFPNAGQQVILLSTNTEVVGEELKAIQPYLNKTFIIQKEKQQKTSRIEKGYFKS